MPEPARSSPRPESIRALRRGEAGVPRSTWSRISRPRRLSKSSRRRQQPVDGDVVLAAAVAGRVGLLASAGLAPPRLDADGGVDAPGLELRQVFLQDLEPPLRRVVAVEPDEGVGGVVEVAVEGREALPRQVGDVPGVAPGLDAVGRVGEEPLLDRLAQDPLGGGVGALHLVVDDAAEGQLPLLDLVVPALLLEDLRRQPRVEDGVEVDVDEVVEVLQVLAGNRVAGAVGVGEGVEEGLQRSLEELDEGLLHRVLAGAAEDGVLEDVGDAGGVGGRRAEGDAEDLVGVIAVDHGDEPGPGGMAVQGRLRAQLGDAPPVRRLEAVRRHDSPQTSAAVPRGCGPAGRR